MNLCLCYQPAVASQSGAACCGTCGKPLRNFQGKGGAYRPGPPAHHDLHCLLYLLIRDFLQPGELDAALERIREMHRNNQVGGFSDPALAAYTDQIAREIYQGREQT